MFSAMLAMKEYFFLVLTLAGRKVCVCVCVRVYGRYAI